MPIDSGKGARSGLPVAPLAVALTLVVLLVAACGSQQEPDSVSGGIGGAVPPMSPARQPAPITDAEPVPTPSPGVVAPVPGGRDRVVAWRLVGPAPGPTVAVEAQLGGSPCDVLTGMDVEESDDAVRLTLWAGREEGARCDGVPALLGTFLVHVPLKAPLGDRAVEPFPSGS